MDKKETPIKFKRINTIKRAKKWITAITINSNLHK